MAHAQALLDNASPTTTQIYRRDTRVVPIVEKKQENAQLSRKKGDFRETNRRPAY